MSKILTTHGTRYDSKGYITSYQSTVTETAEKVVVDRSVYQKDEVTILANEVHSNNMTQEGNPVWCVTWKS